MHIHSISIHSINQKVGGGYFQTILKCVLGSTSCKLTNGMYCFQIAVVAQYHSVPFYVAAPMSTIDFNINSGKQIVIEERPEREMSHVNGVRIAAPSKFLFTWKNMSRKIIQG